jgi:hypothetical protein
MINMALEGVRLLEEKEGSVYPYMNDVMEGINATIREVRDYLVDRLAEPEDSPGKDEESGSAVSE